MPNMRRFLCVMLFLSAPANAEDSGGLSSKQLEAGKTMLCLSTTSPPPECGDVLSNYFDITHKKFYKQQRMRRNYLNNAVVEDGSPADLSGYLKQDNPF